MTKETIKLDFPINVDGFDYNELDMRRPKVKDNLAADKIKGSEGDREVTMMANLCDVAPEVLHELDLSDYGKLQDVYSGFLDSAQKTQD